jgi:hypothetical protein
MSNNFFVSGWDWLEGETREAGMNWMEPALVFMPLPPMDPADKAFVDFVQSIRDRITCPKSLR